MRLLAALAVVAFGVAATPPTIKVETYKPGAPYRAPTSIAQAAKQMAATFRHHY